MPPRRLIITLFAAVLLLLAGCRDSGQPTPTAASNALTSAAWQVDVHGEPFPNTVGDATLIVTVTEGAENVPATGLTVSARGDMNHAGMAPVLAEATEGDPGVYTIPWQWTMSGDWTVDFTLRSPDGGEAVQTIAVTVEG